MPTSDVFMKILVFLAGLTVVILTLFSALSTFVLPRAARSQLNRIVFGVLRRLFAIPLRFATTYPQRDAIMAYYAPIGLMMLLPAWYLLILIGYAAIYWSLGVGDIFAVLRLSGSSLFTLGFDISKTPIVTVVVFTEAMLGLMLVGLLIAYLPTMYAAFSRREQAVNMLEVRAGTPPSALEMLLRFNRIHGLDKLGEYWKTWEAWFADVEESHTTLPALVFFRSPRADASWVTASGAVLDAAAITLSAIDIPFEASAALCIRAGFIMFHRVTDYFDIPHPHAPHFPTDPISISRAEFDGVLNSLTEAGLPIKADREKVWNDFAGWRVNYDRTLLVMCSLAMAPSAPWSGDRALKFHLPPIFIRKIKEHKHPAE
ncbi:MAG: hypothetical protein ABI904_18240 [Chloroflexota bacterium]